MKLDGVGYFGLVVEGDLLLVESPVIGVACRTCMFETCGLLLVVEQEFGLTATLDLHFSNTNTSSTVTPVFLD